MDLSRIRTSSRSTYLYAVIALVVVAVAVGSVVAVRAKAHAEEEKWSRATDYFGRADYEKAAKELDGLDVPTSPERLRVYSQTKLATRDLDGALAGYQKLYAINKDPSVQLIIGNIYNEKKQFPEAIKVYEEAIAANPNNAQAYVNLATLHKQQGNVADAVKVANQGVQNNPGSATLRELQVSMLLDRKDSQEYKDAIAALKKTAPDSGLLKALNL